jgi:16S rRNA (guanine(527)-N(7))-methyltransferase RsmG/2-amino-4-hydroxy-6-hydroxymethyldihydropteridine diphosphokinase
LKKTAVYLSLGSNLGDRAATLVRAKEMLRGLGTITAASPLYETEPVEVEDCQPWYLNCVLAIDTALTPEQLLAGTQAVELALGRRRNTRNAPRTLDIDILLFGDAVVMTPGLSIPHPGLAHRRFVLQPLEEIAPNAWHPILNKTMRELLAALPSDAGAVRRFESGDLNWGNCFTMPAYALNAEKIAELLRPFVVLDSRQLVATSIYLDLLLKWNAKMNLTAVRVPEEMVTRHFGESFFAAARLFSQGPAINVIDLGSGAGFPGLPLAIFVPEAQVTLIEANGKKAAFLNEVVSALKLANVTVVRQRGESFSVSADLVTMRAVEEFATSLPIAAKLVKAGGRLGLMIGASQVSAAKAAIPGFVWEEPIAVPASRSRVLLVGNQEGNRGKEPWPALEPGVR